MEAAVQKVNLQAFVVQGQPSRGVRGGVNGVMTQVDGVNF